MQKVSQAFISINSFTELNKHRFSLWALLKVFSTMKVNIYLKANWHSLIFLLTESVTEPMQRKISLYVGIVNDFWGEISSNLL